MFIDRAAPDNSTGLLQCSWLNMRQMLELAIHLKMYLGSEDAVAAVLEAKHAQTTPPAERASPQRCHVSTLVEVSSKPNMVPPILRYKSLCSMSKHRWGATSFQCGGARTLSRSELPACCYLRSMCGGGCCPA